MLKRPVFNAFFNKFALWEQKPKKYEAFAFIAIFSAALRPSSSYTGTFVPSFHYTDCLDIHMKTAK